MPILSFWRPRRSRVELGKEKLESEKFQPISQESPVATGNPVNPPPSTLSRPTTINLEIAGINQPDAWPYLFIGAEGPYIPARAFGAQPIFQQPPYDRRGLLTNQEVASLSQADAWTFVFM